MTTNTSRFLGRWLAWLWLTVMVCGNANAQTGYRNFDDNDVDRNEHTVDGMSSEDFNRDKASRGTNPYDFNSGSKGTILYITSYNPDTRSVAENLNAFTRRYGECGGKYTVAVENMECGILKEAGEWYGRMAGILAKYDKPGKRPSVIIVTGREATSAYFSQTSDIARRSPVIIGSCSSNIVLLPDDPNVDISTWDPSSYSLSSDFKNFNIIGGAVSHFDLQKNIDVIRTMFPDTKSINVLTDNTLGGISMLAWARSENRSKDIRLRFIDGRGISYADLQERIHNMPASSALLIGTWRIDRNFNFVVGNFCGKFRKANPDLPVFSLSSVGLGDLAVAGYVPKFTSIGELMADICLDYLNSRKVTGLIYLPNEYVVDYQRVKEFKIGLAQLPNTFRYVNEPVSFFEAHRQMVNYILFVLAALCVCLLVAFFYIVKLNKLKTKLRQNNEELRISRDKAEEANRMKSAFLANVSHEIRTPLNSIVGFSRLITSHEVKLSEEEEKHFGVIIRENSDTLLQLINDVLDLSRMESGTMKVVLAEVDVVALCRSLVESMSLTCKKPIAFVFQCEMDSLRIVTDETRLRQVINNLMTNAVKFSEEGTIIVHLELADAGKPEAVFSVSDNGCGIPEDQAENIFERFVKLDPFKQGTGLGLQICRQIVSIFGGRIWVDTSYKKGARFIFTHSTVLDPEKGADSVRIIK